MRDWEPVGKNNTTQIWGLLTPKYGKKRVPYAELKIFSAYTLIRTRLYDSAASTASPLGSAVSLAIRKSTYNVHYPDRIPLHIVYTDSLYLLIQVISCSESSKSINRISRRTKALLSSLGRSRNYCKFSQLCREGLLLITNWQKCFYYKKTSFLAIFYSKHANNLCAIDFNITSCQQFYSG